MMKIEFALILCFCIFIVHGSLFQSPIQLYNAMKVIARKATTTKPALFKNCASDSTWHSIILSAEQTNPKDRRYFVRKVAESVLEKYGNESMFIAAYNEYNRNISIFVQADGNMAEWGTVFSNLEKFSFGCLHSSNGEETGVYVVKRPSEDDLSKISTQKLMAFSRMIGNQQDFKNLLKVDSLANCLNDAAWKSVAQNYTASNLGLDNQQTSLKVLQKLVIQVSNHFENNILSYAYAIKMDPQPKNIVVSFGVEAGAKQSDWLRSLQQVINGCQILRSSSPFSATGMGYMKMKPTN